MVKEKTLHGGTSEKIFFFDKNNKVVEKGKAEKCVIRELDENGALLHETWFTIEHEG